MGEKVLSQATIEKFNKAEEKLKGNGREVMNPASHKFQEALNEVLAYHRSNRKQRNEQAEILLFDLSCIARCDAIYMLRDWKESPGAKAEYYFAKAIGIEILHEYESNT